MDNFKHIALGGTFDRLHIGHKKLITTALEAGVQITIGIASDAFVKNKFLSASIQPYAFRKKSVRDFVASKMIKSQRVEYVVLNDASGPAVDDESIEALVVTSHTYMGGQEINKRRTAKGIRALRLIRVPLVMSSDRRVISSERIRLGDISRNGDVYGRVFQRKSVIQFSERDRTMLKKPLGQVVKQIALNSSAPMIISVGDVVTSDLVGCSIVPAIQIIDHHINRKLVVEKERLPVFNHVIRVQNVAGSLSKSVMKAYRRARNRYLETNVPQQMYVLGEEDLTALVAILFAPLDSHVLYGQPGEGIVVVSVTEKAKARVYDMILRCAKSK